MKEKKNVKEKKRERNGKVLRQLQSHSLLPDDNAAIKRQDMKINCPQFLPRDNRAQCSGGKYTTINVSDSMPFQLYGTIKI